MFTGIKINGKVELIFQSKDGIRTIIQSNLLMNDGRNIIANALSEASGGLGSVIGSPYIAVGINNVSPSPADTQLSSELARKIVLAGDNTVNNKAVCFSAFFNLTEAIPTPPDEIKEAGLFLHNATTTADSGIMVARALINPTKAKTIFETLTVRWTLTFDRV